jgi:hypothetical protein
MCDRAQKPANVFSPTPRVAAEVASLGGRGRRVVTFPPSVELRRSMGATRWRPRVARDHRGALLEATDVLATIAPRRHVAA